MEPFWLSKNVDDVERKGTTVVRREDEDQLNLVKRFKKKVQKHGIEREILLRQFYEKPSVRKRRKRAENLRRLRREQLKLEKFLKRRGKKIDD